MIKKFKLIMFKIKIQNQNKTSNMMKIREVIVIKTKKKKSIFYRIIILICLFNKSLKNFKIKQKINMMHKQNFQKCLINIENNLKILKMMNKKNNKKRKQSIQNQKVKIIKMMIFFVQKKNYILLQMIQLNKKNIIKKKRNMILQDLCQHKQVIFNNKKKRIHMKDCLPLEIQKNLKISKRILIFKKMMKIKIFFKRLIESTKIVNLNQMLKVLNSNINLMEALIIHNRTFQKNNKI